ncbi:cytochrome c [Calothrix sp. 336/3]|uniref:cytochrome c n=1 Tax=Calothrix sp. 336/3 TaxID=1337936 RepID=UPI0004E32F01|nr:cytochrome c [Calothrix sp. 336/3]AKG24567.1 cytochrome C [Calothrix sp. 336/3]
MSYSIKGKFQRQGKSLGILSIVFLWSLVMGWLITTAIPVHSATPTTSEIGTVDIVPSQYQLGQELYLENCASCHVALPPAVLPTQTWKEILTDTQHYGVTLKPLLDPGRILIWKYILQFSRPLMKDEQTPYRLGSSRYFKALHPKINIPRPVQLGTCITCHPGVGEYNYRKLSAEWENAE